MSVLAKFGFWLFDKTIGWLYEKVKSHSGSVQQALVLVQDLNSPGPNFWQIIVPPSGEPAALAIGEFLLTNQSSLPRRISTTLVRPRGLRYHWSVVRDARTDLLHHPGPDQGADDDLIGSNRPVEAVIRFTISPPPRTGQNLVAKVSIVDNLGRSACVKRAFFRAAQTKKL